MDKDGGETRESAYFLSVNRGKKSVTSTSRSRRQSIARALAAKSDVLLENYKVGGLAKYGLAYEDLRKSIRESSTARSPGSASPAERPPPATTSSFRAWEG